MECFLHKALIRNGIPNVNASRSGWHSNYAVKPGLAHAGVIRVVVVEVRAAWRFLIAVHFLHYFEISRPLWP
jgi:hypothetical protein